MNDISGKSYVTKLVAAQRQLNEAIWMFFAKRDELAIHTIASAAYRILRDMKENRQRDEAADAQFTGIFYVVRDYRRGQLPSEVLEDAAFMKFIKEEADRLPMITAATELNDFWITMSQDLRKKYWEEQNAVANYLKHADQDSDKHLDLDKVNNLDLLQTASSAYIDVSGKASVEVQILMIYTVVKNKIISGLPEEHQKTAGLLNKMVPEMQLKACQLYIERLTASNTVTPPG